MPMLARRKFVIRLLTVATSLFAFGLIVWGAELLGTVKSVDADAQDRSPSPPRAAAMTSWSRSPTRPNGYSKKGKIDNSRTRQGQEGYGARDHPRETREFASKIVIKKGRRQEEGGHDSDPAP